MSNAHRKEERTEECLHSRSPLLFSVHVSKATTEMERSGIEVRVARCGRGREAYVAKATTEMERSGIEVRVARCGRGREVHVSKATTEMERSEIEVRAICR